MNSGVAIRSLKPLEYIDICKGDLKASTNRSFTPYYSHIVYKYVTLISFYLYLCRLNTEAASGWQDLNPRFLWHPKPAL